MNQFSERLIASRNKKGLSQPALGGLVGISKAAISSMERGITNAPTPENLFKIAKALNVNAEWLATGKGKMTSQHQSDFAINAALKDKSVGQEVPILGYVPLISWVQAGDWHEPIDNFHPGDGADMLPCPVPHSEYTYCVQVSGESMADEYPEGYIIFVDPKLDPKHNDDVIVRLLPENEVTFKRLMIEGRKKYLKAMNKNWPNPIIPINSDAEFCGVVIFAGKYPKK